MGKEETTAKQETAQSLGISDEEFAVLTPDERRIMREMLGDPKAIAIPRTSVKTDPLFPGANTRIFAYKLINQSSSMPGSLVEPPWLLVNKEDGHHPDVPPHFWSKRGDQHVIMGTDTVWAYALKGQARVEEASRRYNFDKMVEAHANDPNRDKPKPTGVSVLRDESGKLVKPPA